MTDKVNSTVNLAQSPEGLTLTLQPTKEGEADIAYPELVGYLKGLGLPSIDYGAVKLAYKRERGKPLLIH